MCRLFLLVVLAGGLAGCQRTKPPALESKNADQLVDALRRSKSEEKPAIALELSKRGSDAHKAVPLLIEALQSVDPALRQNAALALGKIGPQAAAAVDPLINALADPEWTVRRNAVIALGEVGEPRARTAVEALLRDPDSLVRKAAANSAKRLGGK